MNLAMNEMKIISDVISLLKKGWHKNSFAKDKDGNDCRLSDTNACSWCFRGAILKSLENNQIIGDERNAFLMDITQFIMSDKKMDVVLYNDMIAKKVDDVIDILTRFSQRHINKV